MEIKNIYNEERDFDLIDRAIMRVLLNYKDVSLSTNQIAKKAEISTKAAKSHLVKLKEDGWVKVEYGTLRNYTRKGIENFYNEQDSKSSVTLNTIIFPEGKNVQAATKILWALRYKDKDFEEETTKEDGKNETKKE